MWASIGGWLERVLGLDPNVQGRLLLSLAALLSVWLAQRLASVLVQKQLGEPSARYRLGKGVRSASAIVAALVLARIWIRDLSGVATYLGLVSAGLAIALQTLILNLAGWAFILLRRPFGIGDRIEIGRHKGDVVDMRLFEFTLLEIGNWVDADQSTGRLIHVPNGSVFSQPLANYTGGFRYVWIEVPVLVTFESDWRRAKGLLLDVGRRHAGDVAQDASRRVAEANRRFFISYTHLEPTVYTRVRESGVELTLRCLVSPRARRTLVHRVWEDVLDAFAAEPQVAFAYPTWRIYRPTGAPGASELGDTR